MRTREPVDRACFIQNVNNAVQALSHHNPNPARDNGDDRPFLDRQSRPELLRASRGATFPAAAGDLCGSEHVRSCAQLDPGVIYDKTGPAGCPMWRLPRVSQIECDVAL